MWLNECEINDAQVKVLTNLDWPNLQYLDLERNHITGKGLKQILTHSFPKLQQLSLCKNNVGNTGLQVLASFVGISKFRRLNLIKNQISDVGLSYLFPGIKFDSLVWLFLDGNCIGSNGMKLLSKAQIPKLGNLYMENCRIGNQGVKHLAKADFPNLNSLSLCENNIEYEAWSILAINNWQKVKLAGINRINPTSPIAVLSLILVNWVGSTRTFIFWISNPKIQQNIQNILSFRFQSK